MPLFPRPLVSNLIGNTSSALGVGALEVGATSDSTLSRSGAGQFAMEGIDVLSLSNTKTLTNKTLNDSTNSIGDSNTYVHDLTAVPNQTGGWTEFFVTGSAATTSSTSLVDITGLVTGTLPNSTRYEFECVLDMLTSADVTGIKVAVNCAGGGTVVCSPIMLATSTTNGASAQTLTNSSASGAVMTTISENGTIWIKGMITTSTTGTATIGMKHLKFTSGTSTVNVGSVMRLRKAHV